MRYLIGNETSGEPVYRICEISSKRIFFFDWDFFVEGYIDLGPDLVKPYKVDGKMMNRTFELKHGKSRKMFNMDKVSNGRFLEVILIDWLIFIVRGLRFYAEGV